MTGVLEEMTKKHSLSQVEFLVVNLLVSRPSYKSFPFANGKESKGKRPDTKAENKRK